MLLFFTAWYTFPNDNNCLIRSLLQLLYIGSGWFDFDGAISRCGKFRAAQCAKYGRARNSPLVVARWRALITQELSGNPDNYSIAVLDFTHRRAFCAGGNRGKLIWLRHDRCHVEPLWAARGQSGIGRKEAKMQIAKFCARKADFVGGGGVVTYNCPACSQKSRPTAACAIRNLCAPCDMNRRPSCIFGARFRPTRDTLGETTRMACSGKRKIDAILEKSRELAKSKYRLPASTPQALKAALARNSTPEAKKRALFRNPTPVALKKRIGPESNSRSHEKCGGQEVNCRGQVKHVGAELNSTSLGKRVGPELNSISHEKCGGQKVN